jgi:hypothetical protein
LYGATGRALHRLDQAEGSALEAIRIDEFAAF